MDGNIPRKNTRIEYRIDKPSKEKIDMAALYCNQSPAEFARKAAIDEAEKVLEAHQHVHLSQNEWSRFYDALINPLKINKALQKAFTNHAKALQDKNIGSSDYTV